MHDYKISHDVNHFGTDNPATPVQESVPFVIQVDRRRTSSSTSGSSRAPTAPT